MFIGYILFYGCGLYLYILSLFFYYALLGTGGLMIAIFLFPAAELFPIIAWIITGQFPGAIFLIWALGWIGLILAGIASSKVEKYY